jgi:branched-chain amino acid transport system permease protein
VERLVQTILAGVTNGAVYGIAALGIVVVFRVGRVINLAQGEAITAGALATWWLDARGGWPRPVAAVIVVAGTAAFFGVAARLTLLGRQRLAAHETVSAALVTLALALFTQGVLFAAFGRELHASPPMLGGSALRAAGVSVPVHTLVLLLTTIVLGGAFSAVLRWTMAGRAMVGCSENRLGAAVVGVDVTRTIAWTFAAAGAAGALAGILLAPVTVFSYLTGFGLALRGLAAAALVGFRSGPSGLAAGVAVGVLEAVVSGYLSSGYQDPLVAGALIVALIVWPRLSPQVDHG